MSKIIRSSIALFIGVAIFAGLPLIGWGIADVQGFIGHPARLSYVMLVILLEVFVVIKFPGAGSQRGEGTQNEEAFMHQAFGTEWEGYAHTSRRLIPFVY